MQVRPQLLLSGSGSLGLLLSLTTATAMTAAVVKHSPVRFEVAAVVASNSPQALLARRVGAR